MKHFLLILATLLLALPVWGGEVPRESPPLEFKTFKGKQLSIAELKGKVVLLMFFSTDCPHCQDTADLLKPIYQEYKGKGLEIVGLATNNSAVTNIDAFVKDHGVEFPVGLTTRSEFTRYLEKSVMARLYVPYMVFLGRDGRIQEEHPGEDRAFFSDQEANIRASIERLLAAPAKNASE